MTYVQNEKVGR